MLEHDSTGAIAAPGHDNPDGVAAVIDESVTAIPALPVDSYLVIPYSSRVETPFFENWVTQLRKGMLELCILNSLNGRRLYGYDIVKSLRGTDGLVISEGTIYPILSRLYREGFVATDLEESTEGPPRKYYVLTKAGQYQLAQMNKYWQTIEEGIDQLRKGKLP